MHLKTHLNRILKMHLKCFFKTHGYLPNRYRAHLNELIELYLGSKYTERPRLYSHDLILTKS
jgi:hypothetical protein